MKSMISLKTVRLLSLILIVFIVGCSSYPTASDITTPAPPPIATLQIDQAAQPVEAEVLQTEPVAAVVETNTVAAPIPSVEPTAIPQAPPTEAVVETVIETTEAEAVEVIEPAPEAVDAEAVAVEAVEVEVEEEEVAEPAEDVAIVEGEAVAQDAPVEDSAEPPPPPPEPEIAPTEIPPLGITLSAPIQNARVVAGTALSVSGEVTSVQTGQSVLVELIQQNVGSVRDVNLVAQEGRWSALLPAPEDIVGPMLVKASIRNANGEVLAEATTPVDLVVNEGSAANYIQINTISPIAIAGKGIHLTGTASSVDPIFKINLGIFYNNCSETAGLVSFDMYANGYWEGYLTLPEFATGEICVYAFTGTLGGPDQRLTQEPIVSMEADDENAIGVVIANPRPGNSVYAPLNVDGIAYNPPNGVVNVFARLPNGTVLWEDRVVPDQFGYWQVYVPIGAGEYSAEIVASIGDPNNPIQTTHSINIIPVPVFGADAPAEDIVIEEFVPEEEPPVEDTIEASNNG